MKKILLLIIALTFAAAEIAFSQYWSALGEGVGRGSSIASVYSLAEYNGELYVGGVFTFADTIRTNHIAKWNGTTWSTVGLGIHNAFYESVSSLVVFNGELYVSGYFSIAGGVPANNIAKWNGTSWSSVGTGISSPEKLSIELAVYNGDLYAAGLINAAGGTPVNNIARWNGTNWTSVGTGVDGWIHSLVVYNGELYAGGKFNAAGGVPVSNIAKWNGANWSSVGSSIDGRIYELATYNGELYAGGNFKGTGNNSLKNIARWNGSNWSALSSGANGNVYSFSVFEGSLYTGGYFDSIGNIAAHNIAKWDGTNWAPVGKGTGNSVLCISSYRGDLYAGGSFYGAGNITTARIAKWTNQCTTAPAQPGNIEGNIIACKNGYPASYAVRPVNNASDYTWILPSGWSGNSVDNILSTAIGDNSGDISVIANNPCGSSSPRTVTVIAYPVPPMPSAINGNRTICESSNQTYSVDSVAGATNYSWYLPYDWIGSSTTNSITVTPGAESGTIYLTANNDYCSSDFQVLDVAVGPHPMQPEHITGNNIVCKNSSQSYSINPVLGATDYTWTLPSGWTGSSSTPSITSNVSNVGGTISVTANNSCGSSPFRALEVSIDSLLPQPGEISGLLFVNTGQAENYSINSITGAGNYEWKISGGGVIVTGQNSNSVFMKWEQPGSYTLTVDVTNACGKVQRSVAIKVATRNDNDLFELSLLPNPSSGEFYLKAKRVQDQFISVEVLNMLGQPVYKSNKVQGSNDYSQLIDLKKMAPAIYVVKIIINDKSYIRRIVKK